MLALYSLTDNPTLYSLAAENARLAQTNARDPRGLYLRSCNGQPLLPRYAEPEMLQTQAATTSLFAALTLARPPA